MVMVLIEKAWFPVYKRLVLAGLDDLAAVVHILQNTEVDILEMEDEVDEEGEEEAVDDGEEQVEEEEPIPPELEAKLAEIQKKDAARSPEEQAEFEQFLLRQKMKVRDFRNK